MLTKLRNKLSGLLRGDVAKDDFRDRLIEARAKLDKESADMQRDVSKVGDRSDPFDTVIRNIKKVRGSQ